MTLKLHDNDDICATLRGIASAFEAGLPDMRDEKTLCHIEGFYAALDAVGLSFGVDDWRVRDERRM